MRRPWTFVFFALFTLSAFGRFPHHQSILDRTVLVLLVKGFEPSPYSFLGKREARGEWNEVAERFRQMGFMVRLSECPAGASLLDGAEIIQREVEASHYPVLVVAHSFGGPRSLEAIRTSDRAIANTAGVLLLHCPNHGTISCDLARERFGLDAPVVDTMDAPREVTRDLQQRILDSFDPLGFRKLNPFFNLLENGWFVMGSAGSRLYRAGRRVQTEMFFRLLWGGDFQVLTDASPQARMEYMQRHGEEFRSLAKRVPIVSVIGTGGDPDRSLRRKLEEMGFEENDGVVEAHSQDLGVGGRLSFPVGHMDMIQHPHIHGYEWHRCIDAIINVIPQGDNHHER